MVTRSSVACAACSSLAAAEVWAAPLAYTPRLFSLSLILRACAELRMMDYSEESETTLYDHISARSSS